ncbi:MAG: isochorismate synthase [Verrucomicrobia bacterium]|nr:isochorismate synthase [Verrucomicrobiota bacterium]
MTILPLHPADHASPDALRAFLEQCHARVRADGHPRLVSISLVVEALDPLAVLESIFEPGERHFYAERPNLDTAISGAEVAVAHEAAGPGRFASVQRFVDETLERAIAVGDVEAPFGGPHFFAAFAFETPAESGAPFPSAQVFVPRWQVARAGAGTTAVANLFIEPGSDLDAMALRVWRAHGKFSKFEYAAKEAGASGTGILPVGSSPKTEDARRSAGDQSHGQEARATVNRAATSDYRGAVRRALGLIAAGEFEKIVLARAIDLTTPAPLHPLRVLNGLRQRFPGCYAFSLANGRGQSFIGASPERLLRVSQGVLETEALAGSIRRGGGASDDAALGLALLHSEKDLREHRLVVETITGRLAQLGLKPEWPDHPALRRLANVQHLHTPVRAPLAEGVKLLSVLAALHPTPAVGGSPAAPAIARIRELEGFPRGLYGGTIGWINARGGGEFFVGIRSGLVDGATARVYSGSGIVAGSDPEKEFAETEWKFRAMLDAFDA